MATKYQAQAATYLRAKKISTCFAGDATAANIRTGFEFIFGTCVDDSTRAASERK
jgi:hypothetical protein